MSEQKNALANPKPTLHPVVSDHRMQLEEFIPDSVDPDRFIRMMNGAIKGDMYLRKCLDTPKGVASLLVAFKQCAIDGLVPDGKREAVVLAFNNRQEGFYQASYVPMYQGIVKRIRNSGNVLDIQTGLVCEKDEFDFRRGTDAYLHHRETLGPRGAMTGAWAMIKTKDGGMYFDVMGADDIKAVKNSVRIKNGPWSGAFEGEMWRKTVLRRLAKIAPMSSDVMNIFERDDQNYDIAATVEPTGAERLEQSMRDKAAGKSGALIEGPKDIPDDPPEDIAPEPDPEPEVDPDPPVEEDPPPKEEPKRKSARKPIGEPDPEPKTDKRAKFPRPPKEMSEDEWAKFTDQLLEEFKASKMTARQFDDFYQDELNELAEYAVGQYDRILDVLQ